VGFGKRAREVLFWSTKRDKCSFGQSKGGDKKVERGEGRGIPLKKEAEKKGLAKTQKVQNRWLKTSQQ